jgi:uncharacterized lipoprotein YddW (UPF0748 family)
MNFRLVFENYKLSILQILTSPPTPLLLRGGHSLPFFSPLRRRGVGGEVFNILFFVFLSLIISFSSCKSQQIPQKTPVRGVWITNVDSEVMYSKSGIQEAVKVCQDAGINHIFVVMWNKGRTLYPSKIMAETFKILIEERLAGRDPMREMLDEAHARNIKVYAWFEFGFSAENNGFGKHILETKPAWAALGNDGKVVVKNGFK